MQSFLQSIRVVVFGVFFGLFFFFGGGVVFIFSSETETYQRRLESEGCESEETEEGEVTGEKRQKGTERQTERGEHRV